MSTFITNNIYFSSDGNTQQGLPSDPSPDENPVPVKNNPVMAKGGVKQIAGLAMMAQMGKTVLNYGKTHVQMITGDSNLQDKVNAVGNIAATAVSIALNPIMGIAMTALNLAIKTFEFQYRKNEETIGLSLARRRAGPSLNRSRLES